MIPIFIPILAVFILVVFILVVAELLYREDYRQKKEIENQRNKQYNTRIKIKILKK